MTADQSEKVVKKENQILQKKNQNNNIVRSNEKASSPKRLGVMPRLKRPENETPPLMNVDEKFRKRWHVEGIIGKGGYGEIYLAIDMKRAEEVAIKAEPKIRKGKVAKRMILEQQVLLKMQGKPHVPTIFASGHTEKFNFISKLLEFRSHPQQNTFSFATAEHQPRRHSQNEPESSAEQSDCRQNNQSGDCRVEGSARDRIPAQRCQTRQYVFWDYAESQINAPD